jgi:hypothetical protein
MEADDILDHEYFLPLLSDPKTTMEIKRFDFGPKLTRWFLYAHRDSSVGLQTCGLCLVREEVRP